jgi:hypothetical protein
VYFENISLPSTFGTMDMADISLTTDYVPPCTSQELRWAKNAAAEAAA